MKKSIYTLFLMIAGSTIITTDCFAQANTTLSNLISPTAVNQHLLSDIDNTKDLGSSTKSWKDIYLDGFLYLDGSKFISNYGGVNNVFIGNQAGNSSTTGAENTMLGSNAGFSLSSGYDNTFIGSFTGYLNSSGHDNTFIGKNAGNKNTSGNYNTFLGSAAGYYNTIGYNNTSVGHNALQDNTSGANNTATGYNALAGNTSGDFNAAFGNTALLWNSTGVQNSACGAEALYFNTTGSYNSAFGNGSLWHNTTGGYNSACGEDALFNNTTGEKNTAIGNQAGLANTTADYGTFVGFDAGGSNSTGSQNTYLGYSAEGSSGTYTNVVGIGYQITNTASNQARIGNSSTTSIGGYASWSNISDGRFKKNVKEEVAGLAFINKLRPVTYTLDIHATDEFIGKEFSDDNMTDASRRISELAKTEKEKIIYSGFIAQEVETAAKEIGYDFSGVDAPKNEKDLYGLRYAEFVVPLVKAVQELNEINNVQMSKLENVKIENEKLRAEISEHQKQIDELKKMMLDLASTQNTSSQIILSEEKTTASVSLEGTWLEQNIPNPFNGATIIRCFINETFSSAQLIITSASGITLKKTDLYNAGINEITVDANSISAGIYNYSLIIDGKIIDTKQMILTK
ncbi:MAG: tail fiber domain-containing protein [Fimbriimonadaceae bacterium]|nr:tail fiber domain-containing protein [Chitinophagales bacterium]